MRQILGSAVILAGVTCLAGALCSSSHSKVMSGQLLLQNYHYAVCKAEIICEFDQEPQVTKKAYECAVSRTLQSCALSPPGTCDKDYSVTKGDYYACLGEIEETPCYEIRAGEVPETCWWRDLTSLMHMFGETGPDASP